MAEHTFIKSQKYADLGVAALFQKSVLSNLFRKVSGAGFKYALDDTLTAKTGRVTTARDYEWRTRTDPIVLDKIGQTTVDIKIDKHIYQGVAITNEQLSLDVASFAQEIVSPQVDALVEKAEEKVLLGLRAADFKTAIPAFYESDDPYKWALSTRAILNSNGAPRGDRVLLVGAGVESWLLGSDRIAPSGATPETSRAVRDAILGRLAGFDIVPVPALEDDEVFAVTRDALMIANVTPSRPRGAADAATATFGGWGMLHTFDYDVHYQQDTSVLSTFLGVNSVNDELTVVRDATSKMPRLSLDSEGNPIPTGKNVRGTRGVLTEGDRPTP